MASKIIGNGLLAKAFSRSRSDQCIFFCSGVSNSNETSEKAFKREEDLLKENLDLNADKCIVYFSSILAPQEGNCYFQHKMRMEALVSSYSSNYLICRLPQVAGVVLNTTLLSMFTRYIYEGSFFTVHKNARRTIIDVDDIVEIFDLIYASKERNKIINFCPDYSFRPEKLIHLISDLLNKEANYSLIDVGVDQNCPQNEGEIGNLMMTYFKNNYLEAMVEKYVPKIIDILSQENAIIESKIKNVEQ
ncbi:hypothetical protein [Acinetobacter indicus]|uniref:hypothetical protein n=1 Tax=Acinetobacter indicus TaxID=756892 RepID=UPI001443AF63|nr:hypothetical protein [Acinetobacter indicus]